MLTARQQEILDFLEGQMTRTGVMPSTREIQEHFRFASQTASVNHLKALEKKGAIQRMAGKARAVALPSMLNREPVVEFPLYGQIAAGMPETIEQEPEGRVAIDAASLGIRPGVSSFALRVRGDSMIDAGILDGDFVVARQQPDAEPGDVVVAGIPGEEATVKTFRRRGKKIGLVPSNPAYSEIILPPEDVTVYGKVVTLLRRM